jgi:DNA mismatch repair protein MSH5
VTTSSDNVARPASTPLIESGHPEADDAQLDSLNEVVMAVDLKERGTVGCCYYVAREEKLYFMEDIQLGGLDVVDARMIMWSL